MYRADGIESALEVLVVGDVCLHGTGLWSERRDGLLKCLAIAADNDNLGAILNQGFSRGQADTGVAVVTGGDFAL